MSGDCQREMTLDEWVERLPEIHSARKEYAAIKLVEEKFTSTNTGSPKLSGAVCRWCYGHRDMCEKCVYGSEFSPAAQLRAGA